MRCPSQKAYNRQQKKLVWANFRQTKIKVRLTKKKKSSKEITVYSLHPALGNFPTLLLDILLPLPLLPILAVFSCEVQTLPSPNRPAVPGSSKPLPRERTNVQQQEGVRLHTNPWLISTSRRGNEERVTDRERRFLDDCTWF